MKNFEREFKKLIQELEEILANDERKVFLLKDKETILNNLLIHRKQQSIKKDLNMIKSTKKNN